MMIFAKFIAVVVYFNVDKAQFFWRIIEAIYKCLQIGQCKGGGGAADWFVLATVANSPLRAVTSHWVMQNVCRILQN